MEGVIGTNAAFWRPFHVVVLAAQESILDQCIAVAQNPALFNLYSTAAIMIPEHAEELMDIDAAVSGFLTAVSQVLSSLTWLNNQANLSTGSILQLSHLAAALPTMDGCSDILVTVKLIDMRHQLDQCRLFLKFLGSDSAMRLDPAAQVAHELQCVVALKEKATGQQMHEVLTRSQELFLSADHTAFVKHFAAHDSALYNAYLQQSWQHQTDLLLQLRGVLQLTTGCFVSLTMCARALSRSEHTQADHAHFVSTSIAWPACALLCCSSAGSFQESR